MTLFNLNVSMFGLLWGTATGLGMQWALAAINLFFLWVLGVPVTYYLALLKGGGLPMVWTLINAPYLCMNASLIFLFLISDWGKVQAQIRERDDADATLGLEAQTGISTEEQRLLVDSSSASARNGYGSSSAD